MAEEPENLVLHYPRRLDAKVDIDGGRRARDEGEPRVGGAADAAMRVDFADLRADFVRVEHRLDRADQRLARIETRLGLVDPAIPG